MLFLFSKKIPISLGEGPAVYDIFKISKWPNFEMDSQIKIIIEQPFLTFIVHKNFLSLTGIGIIG